MKLRGKSSYGWFWSCFTVCLWCGNTEANTMRRPRHVDLLKADATHTQSQAQMSKDSSGSTKNNDVQELYFTQTLDHFHVTDDAKRTSRGKGFSYGHPHETMQSNVPPTFQQRYFLSTRYVRAAKKNAPLPEQHLVFVCVGGEGPALDTSVLIDSVHCSGDMLATAQKLFDRNPSVSITLAALEHRYYGQSYPVFLNDVNATTSPVTNENLVFLSSKQATADLAHFIHTTFQINAARDIMESSHISLDTASPRVVLFGGSYPGVLAAFTRLKHPSIVYAAVSNSAPVQAILDFAAYQTHVGQVLMETDPHCHDIVATGHLILSQMIEQRDTNVDTTLAEQFHLCDATSLSFFRNQQLWLGDGVFYVGTQENDPSCNDDTNGNYCNIPAKCRALTTRFSQEMDNGNATIQSASVAALAWMAQTLSADDACLELDWDETVAYISDPVRGQDDGLRSWLWQTCTEFGFYQTCENTGCPFAVGYHPLSMDLELCQRAFGRTDLAVAQAVQATNEYTGGWHMEASRIVSVTGTVDPWTEMSFQNTHRNTTHDMPVYQVPGASHHFWTHPVLPTDDAAIVAARDYIYDTVHDWLFPTAAYQDTL